MFILQSAQIRDSSLRDFTVAAGRLAVTLVAYGLGIALVSAVVLPAILAPLRSTPLAPATPEAPPVIARTVVGMAR